MRSAYMNNVSPLKTTQNCKIKKLGNVPMGTFYG